MALNLAQHICVLIVKDIHQTQKGEKIVLGVAVCLKQQKIKRSGENLDVRQV